MIRDKLKKMEPFDNQVNEEKRDPIPNRLATDLLNEQQGEF